MIVETTFADSDGAVSEQLAQLRQVALRAEAGGVVRMDSGRREKKARIILGKLAGDLRGRERFTNTDDSSRARIASAGDYVVAVAAERRVREVGVTVDED